MQFSLQVSFLHKSFKRLIWIEIYKNKKEKKKKLIWEEKSETQSVKWQK